jgi:t-SNARE complex subunit (syntaxin)
MIETDIAVIHEREEQIRQLEGDILDVNEIFKDLSNLVYEQGEVVGKTGC